MSFDGRYSSAGCYWGNGPSQHKSLHLVNGYTGTVTLGPPLTVTGPGPSPGYLAFELRTGNIAQGSGSPLTVGGKAEWTGGVLNSVANGATVTFSGPTAAITPGAGNTLQTGSQLNFEGAVNAAISTGTLQFTAATSILAAGSSVVNISSLTTTSAVADPPPIRVSGIFPKVYAAGSTFRQGLLIENGWAVMLGSGSVKFIGKVIPGGLDSIRQTGGVLAIECGTILDAAGNDVEIQGGTLTTKYNANLGVGQQLATIQANMMRVGGDQSLQVKINDTAFNPAGDTTHHHGQFMIDAKDVNWRTGTYRPVVNPTDPDGLNGDLWATTGTFTVVAGAPNQAKLAPEATGAVTAGKEFMVMNAARGFIKGTGGTDVPLFEDTNAWGPGVTHKMEFGSTVTGWYVRKK